MMAVLAGYSLRGAAVKFLRCIDSMPDIKPGRKSLPLVISDLVRTRLKREHPTDPLFPKHPNPMHLLESSTGLVQTLYGVAKNKPPVSAEGSSLGGAFVGYVVELFSIIFPKLRTNRAFLHSHFPLL